MGIVKKNTLTHYLNKVTQYNNKINKNVIYDFVGEIGIETANEEYEKTNYKPDEIKSNIREDGVDIIATGKRIAYMEYGTGLVGQGTYQGQLPTKTLTFESPKGDVQTTQGWEYYYNNPKTKILGGWFYGKGNKIFTRGQPAQAQMFYTSRKLHNNIGEQLINKIKES